MAEIVQSPINQDFLTSLLILSHHIKINQTWCLKAICKCVGPRVFPF